MHIRESIDLILNSEATVGDSFYDTFLSEYPEVKQYFERVNLQRQAVLLTMAMLVMEQYQTTSYPAMANYPAMAKYLNELGAKHREWGIPKDLYPYFRAALLDTLRRFHHEDWSPGLEQEWAAAIDQTTTQMLKGYEMDQLSNGHPAPSQARL